VSTPVNKAAVSVEADLLVEFVNTLDIEEGTDALANPDRLGAWIAANTGEDVGGVDAEGLERVRALREALRELLGANNGVETDPAGLLPLREAAERSRFRATVSLDGQLDLAPARADVSGFEARVLLAIERLQAQGAWPRLKACTVDDCRWAFYDTSRNHSRTWCSMDVCGNRTKTRRYRERKGG
jgi:predicted RNA-binding Zn ribbon-like protein